MYDGAIHAVKRLLEDPPLPQDSADRHESTRECLRKEHEIRVDAGFSRSEECTGATDARLHLVGDEEGAVLAAKSRSLCEVTLRRYIHSLPLNRLYEERGNVARREHL